MEAIRRRAVSTVLALLLAAEAVTAVSAAAGTVLGARNTASHPLPAAAPAGQVLAEEGTAAEAWEPAVPAAAGPAAVAIPADAVDNVLDARRAMAAVAPVAASPTATASAKPAAPITSTAKAVSPTPKPAASTTRAPQAATASTAYTGRNHVWIPALGINRAVYLFPCTRSTAPANYVYRWGCAGANNVYLLGHAWGVFKPLHDAYVSGRLRTGMKVYYADASGRVRLYTVRWWRLTRPTTDASWAWAAQSVPSMTLQTCVGSNSQYRLMVRLVRVG